MTKRRERQRSELGLSRLQPRVKRKKVSFFQALRRTFRSSLFDHIEPTLSLQRFHDACS